MLHEDGLVHVSDHLSDEEAAALACTGVSRETFEAMNRAIAQHRLRPVVDRVFPFTEAREALAWMADQQHFGKIVVKM